MKKMITSVVCTLLLCAGSLAAAKGPGTSLFEFHRLVGVSGPFLGAANPVRGLAGGGAAWAIGEAKAELHSDGRLEVTVRGLVLVSSGANPIPNFRAVLSCQIIDGMGAPAVVNLSTGDFPASTTGDADIEATLMLPSQCFAPILFVTNPTGRWFAVSGF
jgi:hypothetical protein